MYGEAFWQRLWRSAGLQFVGLFVIGTIVYGDQPKVGSSFSDLTSFYDDHSTRILIATFILGLAVLNLMWFGAALRSALHDLGQGGWGAAATASSAAFAGTLFVLLGLSAALAHSIAGSGNVAFTAGLNDVTWAGFVLVSFPAAMFVMSSAFGLWRAQVLSNSLFAVGVGVVILTLLGGTTWADSGFWAPDGAYSRFISPVLALIWIGYVSAILTRGVQPTRTAEPSAALAK
jgi:hypothetical protein